MDTLINDDSTDNEDTIPTQFRSALYTTSQYSQNKLYLLFKKNGIEKLKKIYNRQSSETNSESSVFDIPLCDLKDPPPSQVTFETVGDLIYFLNKWEHIEDAVIDYQQGQIQSSVGMEPVPPHLHRPDCEFYKNHDHSHNCVDDENLSFF